MTIKITTPNGGSDSLDFGCAQTAIVATVTGTEVSSGEGKLEFKTTTGGTSATKATILANGNTTFTGEVTATLFNDATPRVWAGQTRSIGTTYTNSTGRPIHVAYTATNSSANTVMGLTIAGVVVYVGSNGVAGSAGGVSLEVPDGATYVTVTNSGTLTLVTWTELR